MNKKITFSLVLLFVLMMIVSYVTSLKAEHGDTNAGTFHFILSIPLVLIAVAINIFALKFSINWFDKKGLLLIPFLITPIIGLFTTLLPFGFNDLVVIALNLTVLFINGLTYLIIKPKN